MAAMGEKNPNYGGLNSKTKARGRWTALKKMFSKPPQVADDLHMMHDYYGMREAVEKMTPYEIKEFIKFRYEFLQEELDEGVLGINGNDAEAIVDSLIDLIVVAVGTIDLLGVNFKKAWYEVLTANMSKEVGEKYSRPNAFGFPDLIKPPGFKNPDHTGNHGLISKIEQVLDKPVLLTEGEQQHSLFDLESFKKLR